MAVEENELSLNDYLEIAKRRWQATAAGFFIAMTAITITAFVLTPVYESQGLITIESPSISTDLIGAGSNEASTAKYVDESVDKVKRKILSRENLLALNEKFNLFPDIQESDKIEEALQNSIDILPSTKSTDGSAWGTKVTVGLDVGFKYSDAETTYRVAKELIDQLLQQNSKERTARATQTNTFLTKELDALKAELEVTEKKVADYKKKHSGSLPEHQQMHLSMLEQLRSSLKGLDRDYANTQKELRYLDLELTSANATLKKGSGAPGTGISALDKARAELNRALVLYKESHPTVKSLKRKVALLESNQVTINQPTNIAGELAIAKINTQIQAARARLDSFAEQKRSVQQQMNKLQQQVVQIPQVESGLFTLLRDYENAKKKYEDVKAKQVNAEIAEKLELGNQAERFILRVSPQIPKYKTSPNRKNIIAMGLLASLGLGLALAILLEFLDKRVRGLQAITSIINTKPIAVVPYIKTQAEVHKEQRLVKYAYISATLLIMLLLTAAYIYFFVIKA